ncbi:LOW QUALITY PROTEIN: uncharacterized protein LOC111346802 [Stylophora pistillata]|uniref:LOW QUALITY PROTEIN: uncharacterized protein LOC111346802 n=1 Tax=Stylophora pistillata TaxID=50429 RepID=UPI000C04E8B1|nr:LOW QUALITY PROTEIN: uncharacterized protein LOC111346802 [Stylophora pistillata]
MFTPEETQNVVQSLKKIYGGKFNSLNKQDLLKCLQLLAKQEYVSNNKLKLVEDFIAPKSNQEGRIKEALKSFEASRLVKSDSEKELKGRNDEIKHINKKLESKDTAVVNLFGSSGVGKTELAKEVCSKWPGISRIFDLREGKDMKAIYYNMLHSLDLAVPAGRVERLQEYVVAKVQKKVKELKDEEHAVLFMLDNVDQFTAGKKEEGEKLKEALLSFLEELLKSEEKRSPLKLLLTSRTKVGEPKKVDDFEVKSLETSFSEKILITEGMKDVKPHQKDNLIRICKGFPLILKGLAAILRQERTSVDDLIARVTASSKQPEGEGVARESLLTFEQEGVDMGQLSVIREMFDTLPTESLKVSAVVISLFCGPFSLKTAAKVLGFDEVEAIALLEGLVASQITFVVDEEAKERKYDIHPLLQKYADSIKNHENFAASHLEGKERFYELFMSRMKKIAQLIEPDYVRAFHLFESDKANYEFTVDISLQPEYFNVPAEFHENALIASLFIAMLHEKLIPVFSSWAAKWHNDGKSALTLSEPLLKEHTDLARCYNAIGNCHLSLKQPIKALEFFEKAYNMQEKLADSNNHFDMPMYKHQIGAAYDHDGLKDYEKAVECYKDALRLLEDLNLLGCLDEAHFCRNLANVLMFKRKYSEAVKPAERALKIRMDILKNHPLTVRSIFQRAVLEVNLEHPDEALKLFLEAWKMEKSLGAGNHSEVWRKIIEGVNAMSYRLKDKRGWERFRKDAFRFCQRFWGEQKVSALFTFNEYNKEIIDALKEYAIDKKDKHAVGKDQLWFYEGMFSANEKEFQEKFDLETDNDALIDLLNGRERLLNEVIGLCSELHEREKLAKHQKDKVALYKMCLVKKGFRGNEGDGSDKTSLKSKVEQLYKETGQERMIIEFRETLLAVWQRRWDEGKTKEMTKIIGVEKEKTIDGILQLSKELRKVNLYKQYGQEALSFYDELWEVEHATMKNPEMKRFLLKVKKLASSIGDYRSEKIYEDALQVGLKSYPNPQSGASGTVAISSQGIQEGGEELVATGTSGRTVLGSQGTQPESQETVVRTVPSESEEAPERGIALDFDDNTLQDIVSKEIADGHSAQLAYERALKDGYVKVYRGRIMLIGQDRAGKTSLKKSLLGLPFDPKEHSTEGIEVDPSKCEIDVDQVRNWQSTNENKPGLLECAKDVAEIVAEKLVVLRRNFEDISGEEDSEDGSMEEYFSDVETDSDTNGHLNNSDISSPSRKSKGTLLLNKRGDHFQESKHENLPNEPEVQIDASSPPDDIIKHLNQWLEYARGRVDINKEIVLSLELWDFAGQHMYYASHPIFLSSRAVYILVHNLSKPLDALAEPCMRQGTIDVKLENSNNETNIENLLSWLATVHSVAQAPQNDDIDDDSRHKLPYLHPPVLIVGTHADKPVDDIAVMKKQIQERICGKEYEKHVVRPLYCVDNTRPSSRQPDNEINADNSCGDAIESLQNRIMEVLREEPYMEEKVPIRWFLFEKVIEALVAKQIYYRNLQQLEDYAMKGCFMEDSNEFDSMISFYLGLGMIIKHRSTVVLKAQWLIDLFKQLITIPRYDDVAPIYSKSWRKLEREGILSTELVDHVFSRFIKESFIKEDILNMMEKFGLISKFTLNSTDVKYFVPAQLKSSPEDLLKMKPSPTDPCPLYIHFVHGFVPHGLFLQLLSRAIRWCSETWPMQGPKLYQNGAWCIIGKQAHDLILVCRMSFIKITVRQREKHFQKASVEKQQEVATLVREFVEQTLQQLPQELPYLIGMQYEMCVACPYCHPESEEDSQECAIHGKVSCTDEDCFHLLKIEEDPALICLKKVCFEEHTVLGMERWFMEGESQVQFNVQSW